MNGDADQIELARLKDEEVELLYEICKRASLLDAPPYKALFEAYSQVLVENGRALQHDATIFRVLIPIGRETRSAGPTIDPLTAYKRLLVANNISIIDDNEEEQENKDALSVTHDLTDTGHGIGFASQVNRRVVEAKLDKRRVSFDDARLEETRLLYNVSSLDVPQGLLTQPPRRARPSMLPRRASISSHHNLPPHQQPSFSQPHRDNTGGFRPAHHKNQSTVSVPLSDRSIAPLPHPTNGLHPNLLFDPSRANLESDAEAFAYTSEMRFARRCFDTWHAATLLHQQRQVHTTLTATDNYQRRLLKAVLEAWQDHLESVLEKERQRNHVEDMETLAEDTYKISVVARKLAKWKQSSAWQVDVTASARRNLLLMRHFQRWRAITTANLMKSRAGLTRKGLALWLDRMAQRELHYEQARAFLEEMRTRQVYRVWCWKHLERKAELWQARNALKHRFVEWRAALHHYAIRGRAANDRYALHAKSSNLGLLRRCLIKTRQDSESADVHYHYASKQAIMNLLHTRATLAPLAKTLTSRVHLSLQRMTLRILQLNLNSSCRAVESDRHRILRTTWIRWNDTLRCQLLSQKIDERILVENLYRWVLEERSRLFRRSRNQHAAHEVLAVWSAKLGQVQNPLNYIERVIAERQQRRLIASGMNHLHSRVRQREDAERAAIEFANSKLLPALLAPWIKQAEHVRELRKWAVDARFFTLTSNAIKTWHDRTEQQKVENRREAYIQIRATMKVRMAHSCLSRMLGRRTRLQALRKQAESREQRRIFLVRETQLMAWQRMAQHIIDMKQTATSLDYLRLVGSSFAALSLHLERLRALESRAEEATREADLDLLGSALRRMQWVSFSAAQHAARRKESAEALWMRNRAMHIKRMIRVWQIQATTRVGQKPFQAQHRGRDVESESPSLRPASRAASRSAQRSGLRSPTTREANTPAYLRTPSRSRKTGRFRPLLPTPALLTPFHFDAAYLTTVPDPLNMDELQAERGIEQGYSPARSSNPAVARHDGLTPQVTPFSRKLRAGGFNAMGPSTTPAGVPSALKSSMFGPAVGGGTTKNVRFLGAAGSAAASRFRHGVNLE